MKGALLLAWVLAVVPWPAASADGVPAPLRIDREVGALRETTLEAGQNRLLLISEPIGRVSVADPNVADLKVITPTQVLLTAKSAGATDLTLWNRDNQPLVVALTVIRNVDALKRQLKELFPKESIAVSAAGELVVLTGEVDDLRTPTRVAEVAKLHSKEVANLITVSGSSQVQLAVRFAEVSRTGLKQVGVNLFGHSKSGDMIGGIVGPSNTFGAFNDTQQLYVPGTGAAGQPPIFPTQPLSDSFQLFFGSTSPFPFNATVSLLEENGLAKVLAEPTLVTMSGQEAKFLAGGELPIPLTGTLGNVTIEWKKFGIQLAFTPTVLDPNTISLRMASEVSELNPSNGIQLGSVIIPGLTSRQAETTVRLGDGQSFAVAGLLSDTTRTSMSKVPGIGSLPIIGALFRSSQYRREETELLVVITAQIVKPVAPREAPALPTDYAGPGEPDSFSFFLLGKDEVGKPRRDLTRGAAGPSGFAP